MIHDIYDSSFLTPPQLVKKLCFLNFLSSSLFTVPTDDDWCLEKHELHGHLFWQRRDSSNSRVKFKHDVEVLEFERDPEEDLFSRGEFSHIFGERRQANPIVVISTIACAFAVTIFLPWFMISASSEPME